MCSWYGMGWDDPGRSVFPTGAQILWFVERALALYLVPAVAVSFSCSFVRMQLGWHEPTFSTSPNSILSPFPPLFQSKTGLSFLYRTSALFQTGPGSAAAEVRGTRTGEEREAGDEKKKRKKKGKEEKGYADFVTASVYLSVTFRIEGGQQCSSTNKHGYLGRYRKQGKKRRGHGLGKIHPPSLSSSPFFSFSFLFLFFFLIGERTFLCWLFRKEGSWLRMRTCPGC